VGITNPFSQGFVPVSDPVQKGKDVIWDDLVNFGITELPAEQFDDGLIGTDGIFFSSGFCGNRSRCLQLCSLSWLTSFGYWDLTYGLSPR
jgi:hypothetical protein